MKKKFISSLLATVVLFTFNAPAFAYDKCDDYRQAIKDNCGQAGGWQSGSSGSCLGAQISALIHGCF